MNKQRITQLTQREKNAHASSGGWWGARIVPRARTLQVLKAYKITGASAEQVVHGSADPLGKYQLEEQYRTKRLSRAELIQQAKETAATARELRERIQYMDQRVRAWASSASFRAWDEEAFPTSGMDFLMRLEVLMEDAAQRAASLPSKVPRRTGPRNELLKSIAETVAAAVPSLTKMRAREVASALLDCWGVSTPDDVPKLRRAARGAK